MAAYRAQGANRASFQAPPHFVWGAQQQTGRGERKGAHRCFSAGFPNVCFPAPGVSQPWERRHALLRIRNSPAGNTSCGLKEGRWGGAGSGSGSVHPAMLAVRKAGRPLRTGMAKSAQLRSIKVAPRSLQSGGFSIPILVISRKAA